MIDTQPHAGFGEDLPLGKFASEKSEEDAKRKKSEEDAKRKARLYAMAEDREDVERTYRDPDTN